MLVRHAANYFVASVVTAVVGVVSAMIFTRLLSPSEYGVFILGVSTAGILSAALFTWVRLSVMRYQSEGGDTDVRGTALVGYLISVCVAPAAFVAIAWLAHLSLRRTLATLAFTVGIGLFELGLELLKARMETARFVYCSILRSMSSLALCLVAAYFGGGGLGQLSMAAAAYFVASLVFAPAIWKKPMARMDVERLHTFLRFGGPATVAALIFTLHSAMDRLVVAHILGESAAGQYGAAADLTRQIILIPAASVASAAVPMAVFALAANGASAARRHLADSFELLFAIVLPAVIGVALTADNIAGLILGPQFRETANAIMPILAFAWLSQSISQSYVHASFHLAQKPSLLIVHSAGTLIVNAVLMLWLTGAYGLRGAALSLVFAEAAGLALGFGLTRWAHPLPMAGRGLVRVSLSTAAMAFVVICVKPAAAHAGPAAIILLAAAGGVTYAVAAIMLNVAGSRGLAQRFMTSSFGAGRATLGGPR